MATKTFKTMTLRGIVEVPGTKLSDEYFAYKIEIKGTLGYWCIVDTASGLSIASKLKTLKDCKDYVANLSEEEIAKINASRATEKYKAQCEKMKAVK
ncbi:MAG: hypothetical protein J6X03_00105 [Bacilli bacterium]|nr:hypothetical protein [Bacilli bacterium]